MGLVVLLVIGGGSFVVWVHHEIERGRQSVRNDTAQAKKTIEATENLLAAVEFQNKVAEQPTFAAAIAQAKSMMKDTVGSHSEGTLALLTWSTKHTLAWSDVAPAKPETTMGLANKNSDLARGKRSCARGTIASIEASRLVGTPYVGLMGTNEGAIHFAAVRDTGDLVALSDATFCGVVTGKFNNVVQVVGMFDLPSNHK